MFIDACKYDSVFLKTGLKFTARPHSCPSELKQYYVNIGSPAVDDRVIQNTVTVQTINYQAFLSL